MLRCVLVGVELPVPAVTDPRSAEADVVSPPVPSDSCLFRCEESRGVFRRRRRGRLVSR
jgi:hypothetical protein